MKKLVAVFFASLMVLLLIIGGVQSYLHQDPLYLLRKSIAKQVEEEIESLEERNYDGDQDGIPDWKELVSGARKEVKRRTRYQSAYYSGGYPPEGEGVCTDVIWRAFQEVEYQLKDEVDIDIQVALAEYTRIDQPDPNIDFRRVKNLFVFFERHYDSLILEVQATDIENLMQWRPGDIVITKKPDHIAIISDKRRKDGVPYVIHNAYGHAKEEDRLLEWYEEGKIIGHYRWGN